jgi:hypothetical protein
MLLKKSSMRGPQILHNRREGVTRRERRRTSQSHALETMMCCMQNASPLSCDHYAICRTSGSLVLFSASKGERGIAQPAVAVIPIAFASELLRQRRGRSSDDPACRRIGHRLQGQQGTQHRLSPVAGIRAPGRPATPKPSVCCKAARHRQHRLIHVDNIRVGMETTDVDEGQVITNASSVSGLLYLSHPTLAARVSTSCSWNNKRLDSSIGQSRRVAWR